jgi:hypothetical protein
MTLGRDGSLVVPPGEEQAEKLLEDRVREYDDAMLSTKAMFTLWYGPASNVQETALDGLDSSWLRE